jgi:signal transduction histidine kinase
MQNSDRINPPVPENEMDRIIKLAELDIDYSDMQENLKDLTKLAAKVAGTEISLINLIDTFTQWTISNYGLPLEQMPREDSVCQYTIVSKESFEVNDLAGDDRFKDKFYVKGEPMLRYYFGIPLETNDGFKIGALCVLDKVGKEITPEKVELLKIIADEIVNRFMAVKVIQGLQNKVKEAKETQRKVAHDIRGPLGGIINLAQLISAQGDSNKMEEVLGFIKLIQKSGSSLLDLADEILSAETRVVNTDATENVMGEHELNLMAFKEKLEKLYLPQAMHKKIQFEVKTDKQTEQKPFNKNKLLQIAGNLISNAIKFTPEEGTVTVELALTSAGKKNLIQISVADSGTGMNQEKVEQILSGNAESSGGTQGEKGYGFGLSLVKHLVDSLQGTIQIQSMPGKGTRFDVILPQSKG